MSNQMQQPHVALAVVVVVSLLGAIPSYAQEALEEASPGPTGRIVRLAGEAGRLRQSIEAALDSLPTITGSPGTEAAAERSPFPAFQTSPQPHSQGSWASWKFYAGLVLLTLAVAAFAWAF